MSPATAAADEAGVSVAVADELTIRTATEHKAGLLAALDSTTRLRLDLSGVAELDTAGLQVLLALVAEARSSGKAVELADPTPAVTEVIALAQLGEILAIRACDAEAVTDPTGKEGPG
jgi:anti-sigma B factor antagonist